jgi:transposase
MPQWLYANLKEAGFAVELLETRHVRDAFKTMPVKTDRSDARGIAQLMRLGWFGPVHCKPLPAREVRALLTARKLVKAKPHAIAMSLRGILRGFGLKAGVWRRRHGSPAGSGNLWNTTRSWRRPPRRCLPRTRCRYGN